MAQPTNIERKETTVVFEAGFLSDDSLTADHDGFRIGLRLPWMRSLPFSSVLDLQVALDSEEIPVNATRLVLDDHEVELDELAERYEDFWFPQRRIEMACHLPGRVTAGETYAVRACVELRIPYLPGPPPDGSLHVRQLAERALVAAGAGS